MCFFMTEYAGACTLWTNEVWAFPQVPPECLKFNFKVPRTFILKTCTLVRLSSYSCIRSSSSQHQIPFSSLLCSHRLLTAVYESKGDLLSALQHEKEAYSIYRSQVCFGLHGAFVFAAFTHNYNLFLLSFHMSRLVWITPIQRNVQNTSRASTSGWRFVKKWTAVKHQVPVTHLQRSAHFLRV